MSMAQFAPRRIIETTFPQYPEGSYCLRVNGQITEVITNGYAPASPPYYTELTDGETCQRSHTPSDETDSPSPRIVRTYSYDRALFDFRKVPPEKIAAQMTLLDLPLFKAVTPQELRSGGWTKKDKLKRAPNVVAFTRRFNQTSFLVMDEILNEESPKVRAEIISQFIRVAKKLHDLNNIHGLKAVIAGLQSAPIYRLNQTWRYVNKKDMNSYSKMVEFLSEEDNWKRLRDHMATDRLPCVPYLGLFLTDLCFINEVPSKRAQTDAICNTIAYFQNSTYDEFLPETHIQNFLSRTFFFDEFQRVFEDEKFRLSLKYEPVPNGGKCTPPSKIRLSKSYEDLLGPFSTDHTHNGDADNNPFASKPVTPVVTPNGAVLMHRHSYHNIRERSHTMGIPMNLRQPPSQQNASPHGQVSAQTATRSPFKSRSSRNSAHLTVQLAVGSPFEGGMDGSPRPKKGGTLPKEFRVDPQTTSSSHGKRTQSESEEKARKINPRSLVPWRRHRKANSVGGNALASLGIQKHSPTHSSTESQASASSLSRSLIDNDDTFSAGGSSFTGSVGNLSNFSSCSCDSREVALVNDEPGQDDDEDGAYDVHEEHLAMAPILQGELKKKLLKKAGKTVSQLRHRKRSCWVQLNDEYLVLLNCKPRPSSKPPKLRGFISRLKDCRVKYKDPSEKMNDKQFILVDDEGSHIRFEAKTAGKAMEWVESIRRAISDEQERERQRVNQSLIQFNDP